jgi:mRNA-degrading endonuclease RelE of RelBE toxin-antitoxin system
MPPYQVYMHSDLLDSVPKTGQQRRKILEFIRYLRDHPGTAGDYTETGESLREYQVKIIGKYAIEYWLDSPVRIVMVMAVRLADRSR